MHVFRAGQRLGVGGGLLDGLAGGVEAEGRETLDVRKAELRELGELVDRSLVGRGDLVDLEHGGSFKEM